MGVADLSAVEEALDTEKQGTCVTTDNCPDPSRTQRCSHGVSR
jgi:hypothetical protein